MKCINGCTENCFCRQPSPPNPALSDKEVEKDSSPQTRKQRLLQAQTDYLCTLGKFKKLVKKNNMLKKEFNKKCKDFV
jgi:hypothetical protein